jgi:hypothetical protein
MPSFDPTADAISQNPLPPNFKYSPSAIAKWIDDVVPCVQGTQSEEVTRMVVDYLRKRLVSDANISAALSQSIYKFSYPMNIAVQFTKYNDQPNAVSHMVNPPPAYSERNDSLEDVKRRIKILDGQYEYARLKHNTAQMEKLLELAWALLAGYAKTRRDKDKMDQVREEILRNARNMAPIIRRAEREGLAPGPDGRTPRRVGVHEWVLEDAEGEAEGERD